MNLAPAVLPLAPGAPGVTPPVPVCGAVASARAEPEPVASEALFQGQRTVEISHNGEIYRLQATRLGKLILTK